MPAPAPDVALNRWLPGMGALALIWGSSFLFIKVAVAELHPLYVTLGRVGFGALTLTAVVAVSRQRLPRDPTLWAHNAVVAAVGTAAPFTLFAYGEQRVSSVLAGIWNSVTPLVVLPMAVLAFRTERFTPRKLLGLALGLLGALVILGVWRGVGGSSLAGQLMCFGAAACYGFAIPYQKRFVAPRQESGLVISLVQLLLATALMAVLAPVVTGDIPEISALSGPAVASIVALGALGTGIAFVIHMRNIRLIGATLASMVTYIIPIFATLIGVMVLREDLHWYQPVGAAVVLTGVAVSQGLLRPRSRLRPDAALAAGPAPIGRGGAR
ncbi:MAG: DMT family transporter [Actinomycetes bacterium]